MSSLIKILRIQEIIKTAAASHQNNDNLTTPTTAECYDIDSTITRQRRLAESNQNNLIQTQVRTLKLSFSLLYISEKSDQQSFFLTFLLASIVKVTCKQTHRAHYNQVNKKLTISGNVSYPFIIIITVIIVIIIIFISRSLL